ncbi:MAG: YdcF family protein [Bdellovibrionales bacterium]
MEFLLSKVLWTFAAPGNLLVLTLLAGAFLATARRTFWAKSGRMLVAFSAGAFFLIAVLPVGEWSAQPLENRFPTATPEHVDGIILIGGSERARISEQRGQPIAMDTTSRYILFTKLARQYPNAKLVFSGGSGSLAPWSGMKDYEVATNALKDIGFPVEKLIIEKQSRNTRENAVMAAQIVKPQPQEIWLLVTSAMHMPRAMGCFRQAGWNVLPAPAGYLTGTSRILAPDLNLQEHLSILTRAIREYIGLVAYRAMGFTNALWPG